MMAHAASPSSSEMISLKTSDGKIFEVETSIAKQMQTVQTFIDEGTSASSIPLHNVCSGDLTKIIEYCRQHLTGDAKDFDVEFTKALSNDELKKLLMAAKYLNMKDLLDLMSQSIADRIQNKSVEFVRKVFGIVDTGFTEEEEASLRREIAWAFEGVDTD